MLSQILLDGFLGEFMKFWFSSSSFCSNPSTTSHLTLSHAQGSLSQTPKLRL